MRKLTHYIGSSRGGFVADPAAWARHVPGRPELVDYIATEYPETLPGQAREQLGLDVPGKHFDTIVHGRGSYALALVAEGHQPVPAPAQLKLTETTASLPTAPPS